MIQPSQHSITAALIFIKEKSVMETIIKVLEEIKPGLDWAGCEDLLESRYLDSLAIVTLMLALNETFDIKLGVLDLKQDNFRTVQSIHDMVQRLLD